MHAALSFAAKFALQEVRQGDGYRIAVITKDTLALSASDWAQGGIAAVMAPDDAIALHEKDTLRAGADLCEPEAVRVLVESAKAQIEHLVALGVEFDRDDSGALAQTLEAAHSRRRVLHAADATGRALVSVLAARVAATPSIQVFPQTLVLDLYCPEGRCAGAWCTSAVGGSEVFCAIAPIVVLATGGGARVFAHTTNPPASTGDGVAIAWRAGAIVRDLEFVQFHPTALAIPGAPRFLISEAVRGEGAHLIDERGDRFAFDYDPRGELAPRDVVSRAIFDRMQRTGADRVFLDLRPIPRATIAHRFPNILNTCQRWGVDPLVAPIPVTPAAHYCMGGIATDTWGATSIPGLYAVGEAASTGVHGANRLASNSLLECFVFGRRLVERAIAQELATSPRAIAPPNKMPTYPTTHAEASLAQLADDLRHRMWQAAGIRRDGATLTVALQQIEIWRSQVAAGSGLSRLGVETRNMTDFAYLLLRSALFRTESRGAHYRTDYPATDAAWQVHTTIQGEDISRSPLGSMPFQQ